MVLSELGLGGGGVHAAGHGGVQHGGVQLAGLGVLGGDRGFHVAYSGGCQWGSELHICVGRSDFLGHRHDVFHVDHWPGFLQRWVSLGVNF